MKMKLFVRHCFYSAGSVGKGRPVGFDRRNLFERLLGTLDDRVELTVLLDETHRAAGELHFTECMGVNVVRIDAGTDARSFAGLLNLVRSRGVAENWAASEVVVFLEDDYDVRAGWIDAVLEGLKFGSLVTCYDHPDKYSSLYGGLRSIVRAGKVCHWRTTPSTTNSYALTWGRLSRDFDVHYHFCQDCNITRDYAKFIELGRQGRVLVSSMPSYWSHEETGMQPIGWQN